MKIVKSLEESTLPIKGIIEKIKNEEKKQKEGALLSMMLGTLAGSILGNALTGWGVIRAGKGTIRTGENI